MYGNRRPRYPSGGGGGAPPPFPPHQPQPPQLNPNFAFQNPNIYFSNPYPALQLHDNPTNTKKEDLEKIDHAVLKARNQIIAAGESVTAWKICQSATLMLEVDSCSSLGFPMQEVPSFRELMDIEAKINAFINCFVGVQTITTLYDLEEAICKNERIGTFEELELGPFLRHQLVMLYFSVSSDITEVVKITDNDIIIFLCEYLDTHKKKDIKIDDFLDFIANKRSLASKEKLGVRITNLRMHVKFIREARISEDFFKKKKVKRRSKDDGQGVKLDEPGILLSDKSTGMFITIWKEACKVHTDDEVLGKMINFCAPTSSKKKLNF